MLLGSVVGLVGKSLGVCLVPTRRREAERLATLIISNLLEQGLT